MLGHRVKNKSDIVTSSPPQPNDRMPRGLLSIESLMRFLATSFAVLAVLSVLFVPIVLESRNELFLFLVLWIVQVATIFLSIFWAGQQRGFAWFILPAACHLLLVNINLYYFWLVAHWLFEYLGSDSTLYARFGAQLAELPMSSWVRYMDQTKYDFQDYGFPFIKATLYGYGFSEYATRLVNSSFALLTGYFVYKSILLTETNVRVARVFTAIYLVSPITVYFASSGLKETFFAFFVTAHFYAFARLSQPGWAIGSGLALAAVPFFRLPTVVFIVLSHFVANVRLVRIAWLRRILLLGVVAAVAAFIILNLNEIANLIHFVERIGAGRFSGQGSIESVALLISGLIGPLPAHDLYGPDFSLSQYFIGTFLKMLLVIFFFVGVRAVLLERGVLYAIALFSVINILSLTAIGETLKIRYHMSYWPQFMILCAIGFLRWKPTQFNTWVLFSWAIGCALITLVWNLIT